MNPRHGEVWLVDMGMAAKTRPAVVLIADHLDVLRHRVILTYQARAQAATTNAIIRKNFNLVARGEGK